MSAECRIANSLALTVVFGIAASLGALILVPHASMAVEQKPTEGGASEETEAFIPEATRSPLPASPLRASQREMAPDVLDEPTNYGATLTGDRDDEQM